MFVLVVYRQRIMRLGRCEKVPLFQLEPNPCAQEEAATSQADTLGKEYFQ
jgi:hypothetical protein